MVKYKLKIKFLLLYLFLWLYLFIILFCLNCLNLFVENFSVNFVSAGFARYYHVFKLPCQARSIGRPHVATFPIYSKLFLSVSIQVLSRSPCFYCFYCNPLQGLACGEICANSCINIEEHGQTSVYDVL